MMATLQGWGTNLLLAMVSSFAEVLVVGTKKILSFHFYAQYSVLTSCHVYADFQADRSRAELAGYVIKL
jgi:hypothetical protein